MIAVQFGSGNAAGRAVGLRMDLLWENDAPASSFAAQTVSVDLSGYAQVMVVPIFSNSNQNPSPPVIVPVEDGTVMGLVVGSGTNNNVGSRTATIDLSAPGIDFAGGRYGGNNNNAYCVPMWIYGIRTGSGSSSGSGGGGGGGGGVSSVNGMTGAVILDATDVGALPSSTSIPSTAADVGAIAAPSSPTVGDFLVYTSNGWAAQSLSTWQGGNY